MIDKEKLKTFIERIINICDSYIEENPDTINIGIAISKKNVCKQILQFINSLQSEVTEKKDKDWSEEDSEAIGQAIIALESFNNIDKSDNHFAGYSLSLEDAIKRLKSFKQRMKG